jgi:hypothetical protein
MQVYSASSTSWICGGAAALVFAVTITVGIGTGAPLDVEPVGTLAMKSLAAIGAAGGVMVIAVRGGLLFARCRELELRFVFCITILSLLIIWCVLTLPFKTYGVTIDMPTTESEPSGLPPAIWFILSGAAFVPALVSYVIGRLARAWRLPPNTSFERTREGKSAKLIPLRPRRSTQPLGRTSPCVSSPLFALSSAQ